MSDTIKVCCRFRQDQTGEQLDDWEFINELKQIKLRDKKFTFDEVLDMDTDQNLMYEKVAAKLIEDFTNGYHGTLFAYGNSGSGKTYSIVGPEEIVDYLCKDFDSVPLDVQKLYGVIPRATIEIFNAINEFISHGASISLKASYIEIYNESITCLLNGKENLKIHEIPKIGFNITGKEERPCKTPEDIFKVIYIGSKRKIMGGTNQNLNSSRSHTILTLELKVKTVDGSERSSKLNIVDLAGSEKLRNTGVNNPERLKEAQKINLSLTTLGMCIMALTENSSFVPFRNSKLTLLLKESLGGNSKTTLLCAARRDKKLAEDNLNSLYFAQRAKTIKTKSVRNIKLSDKETDYLITALKNEIVELRSQIKNFGFIAKPITDPKILEIIAEEIEDPLCYSVDNTDKKIVQNKDGKLVRQSLLNLTEDEVLLKYCNLKAKYENLVESASLKIYDYKRKSQINDDISKEVEGISVAHLNEKNSLIKELTDFKILSDNKEKLLSKEKQNLETTIEEIKAEAAGLQEMLDLNQLDIESMSTQMNSLEDEVKKLKIEKEELTKTQLIYQEQISNFTVNLEDKESQRLKLLNQLIEKEGVIDELKNQKQEKELLFNNTLDQLLNLKIVKENLEENYNKKENELYEYRATTDNIIREFNLKIQNLENIILDKNNINQTLQIELDGLRLMNDKKISDHELVAAKEKIFEENKKYLEEKISNLNNNNSELNSYIMNLETKKSEEINSMNSEINQLKTENIEIQFKFKQSTDNYELLKKMKDEQLDNKLSDIANLRDENNLLQSQILSNQNNFNSKLQDLNNALNEAHLKNNELNEVLSKNQKDSENCLENKNNEITDLKKEILNLQEKLSNFQDEKKQLVNYCNSLENINKENTIEITNLSNDLSKNKERVTQMRLSIIDQSQNLEQSDKINKKVDFKKMFGIGMLKKAQSNFIDDAIKESKTKKIIVDNLNQDKLEELKQIRQNIENLTPVTVSSHDSNIEEVEDIDFNNPQAFLKHQSKLEEKEKERERKRATKKSVTFKTIK